MHNKHQRILAETGEFQCKTNINVRQKSSFFEHRYNSRSTQNSWLFVNIENTLQVNMNIHPWREDNFQITYLQIQIYSLSIFFAKTTKKVFLCTFKSFKK